MEKKKKSKPGLLIVDDEKDILESLKGMFRKAYDVETCNSAAEALEKLRADPNRFSVVVTDERMPNMTGHEFLTKLRDENEEIIGILFTGYSDTNSIVKAINDGRIFGCQFKGNDPMELKNMVNNAFSMIERQELLIQNQYFDMLTGMRTGHALMDMLDKELDRCRRYDQKFVCIMVNLRELGLVNDLYDVEMEDMIVAGVASTLHAKIRGSDYIGRLNKSTFIAVLVGADEEGGNIFKNRCLQNLNEFELHAEGKAIHLEIAASSVAITQEVEMTVDGLLEKLENDLESTIQQDFEQY